jgi:hypothetical protein
MPLRDPFEQSRSMPVSLSSEGYITVVTSLLHNQADSITLAWKGKRFGTVRALLARITGCQENNALLGGESGCTTPPDP